MNILLKININILNITFAGYLFVFVIILSFILGRTWLSSNTSEKPGCFVVGIAMIVISMSILFPASICIQFFGNGSIPVEIGIAAFCISITVAVVYFTKSKKTQLGTFLIKIFFGIGALMLLGMMAGMGYYTYQRLFTHQKDNDEVWVVFICIFFLAVLVLVLFGYLFKGRTKNLITAYDDLEEAKLNADRVISLDLSGKGLVHFPSDILKFNNLTSLDLSNNQITQLPAALSSLKRLDTIKLSNNPISDIERAIIRKLFPQETEIIFRK